MANNVLKEELVLNSSQFDKNVNNVIKKVEELKHKGKNVGHGFDASMGRMIQQATGFNGSLGSLIGVVGKFAGALGVAMTASEAFNKMIDSSQALTDNFRATQQEATTVVDNFFQSLASGDFSPFLNGMDNIIAKAREAYIEMDALWNMAQSFSVQNARLNNKFQQNINEIRAKKNSKDPNDKKRVKELTEENNRIIEQQTKGGVKLYNQTISSLQSEIAAGTGMNSKITEGAIFRIVENDINNLISGRERYKKEYKKYLEEQKKLQSKYSKRKIGGGGLINKVAGTLNPVNYGVVYQRELNKLQSKYGEAIAANYLLERKSDKELQEFNNTLMQGIHYQGVAIANQSKMLRYTNNSASGGGGGTRKPTRTSRNADVKSARTLVYNAENEVKRLKELLSDIDLPFVAGADVINDVNKNISYLNEQLKYTVTGSKEWLKITNQIKEETKKLSEYQDNSIGSYQEEIEEIDKRLKNENLSIPTRMVLQDKKDELQAKIDELSDDAYITVTPIVGDRKRRRNSISNAQTNVDNIVSDYNSGILDFSTAQSQIDEINEQLHQLGLEPIKVHLETDAQKKANEIADAVGNIGGAFSQLGSSLQMPQLDVAGTIAGAIASVIEGYGKATSQAASLGPWAWVAFSLAGLAQVAAIVAQIHSLSSYANGGVVGGSQYAGDALLARVNSGEMILTGSQQKNLFNLIDKGGNNNISSGNVNFVIRGNDLHGVLQNYNSKMKKVR